MKAYYEALYEQLEAKKELLLARIERLLREEISVQGAPSGGPVFEGVGKENYAAYLDACQAFLDERIETYNPVGIQYTFDRVKSREAADLELQLNWYDSREEFESLVETVHSKKEIRDKEGDIWKLAEELIQEAGAFPDNSIISAYEAQPSLQKLPDYVVARAIEETIR